MTNYYKHASNKKAQVLTGSQFDIPAPTSLFFILLGQSNMSGQGIIDEGIDVGSSKIYQVSGDGQIDLATESLINNSAHNSQNGKMGLGLAFARKYSLSNPTVTVYLVLCAEPSTSFGGGDWVQGGTNYNEAVAAFNMAQDATESTCGGILWHQGESDSTAAYSGSYASNLSAFVSNFKSDVEGDQTTVPFITGTLVDGWMLGDSEGFPLADRVTVNNALIDAQNQIDYCANASLVGLDNDGTHFYDSGYRAAGLPYYNALISNEALTVS